MIHDRGANPPAGAGIGRALATLERPLLHIGRPERRARKPPSNTIKVTATRTTGIRSLHEVIETTAIPTVGIRDPRGGIKMRAIPTANIRNLPRSTIQTRRAMRSKRSRRGDIVRKPAVRKRAVAAAAAARVIIGHPSTKSPNRSMTLLNRSTDGAPPQTRAP